MSAPAGVVAVERLPTQPEGREAPEWWGVLALIVIEGVVFTALIASYFHFRTRHLEWPPPGIEPPELLLASLNTVLLIASALPVLLSVRALRGGNERTPRWALPVGMLMLVVFVAVKAYEYSHEPWGAGTHAYGSVVFTMTGLHLAHVSAVLLKTGVVWSYLLQGRVEARRPVPLEANALYWYFVIAVWIPLFTTIYLVPRIF
ncbi:MAG: cytochrome c oxidase subunit 3 [Gemmatimonadetes bacterium]|nr:cytochrome c oxidase subunit 3 [Gemmatimonadota bacterium]